MKSFLGAVVIASAGALTTGGARGAEPAGAWYISPAGHGIWADDLRNVDDDWAFNLAIGKAVSERLNLELDGWRGEFDGPGGDDLTLTSVGVSALLAFYRESRLAPYVLLGAGWLEKNYEISANESDLYVDTGVGIVATLHRSSDCRRGATLRADLRARHDFAETARGDERLVDYMSGVGVQFFWGGPACAQEPSPVPVSAPTTPLAPAAPASTDSDGDGVTDDKDRCPGTSAGARVDAGGCKLDDASATAKESSPAD